MADLKLRAEELADLLTAEHHPQQASEKLISILQEVQRSDKPLHQVINYRLPRQNSRTSVHLAASKGLWQCLEVLLKNGGDPNALSTHKDLRQAPLHLAAREGNGKCIEVLLENGANLSLENTRRETALALASDPFSRMKIEHTIARFEVPKRNRNDENVVKELHQFVGSKQAHLLFQLYTNLQPLQKVDLGTRWNDLHTAPDASETLLYRACASEAEDIVGFMLSKSENQPLPNLKTADSPLHAACEKGNNNIVLQLLQHSPKLLLEQNSDRKSALHIACTNGYGGVVEIILSHVCKLVNGLNHVYNEENPFSLDFRDTEEATPFYRACLHGFSGIVKQFLEIKANPEIGNSISVSVNVVQKDGHSALHAAACSGSSEVVEQLLLLTEIKTKALAQPVMETKRILWKAIGGTPYEDASKASRKIFVSTSGELITDENGLMVGDRPLSLTPLAEACAHDHNEAVLEAFLKNGVRDNDGIACRVLAIRKRFDLIPKLLAYHCKAYKEKIKTKEVQQSAEDVWNVELCWDDKKLPLLKSEWVGRNARFLPTVEGEEFDDAGDRRRGQRNRISPTASLGIQLPQRIDHQFIRIVTLKSNNLKAVPLELFQLKNVTRINLSGNRLVILPADKLKENRGVCGWECKQLQELKLSHNMLTEIPLSVWFLPNLKTIEVTNNSLKKLAPTESFSTLSLTKALIKIDVSHNRLTKIEAFVAEFPNLKTLHVCHNQLTTLPLALWASENLNELLVSHNQIANLTPPLSENHPVLEESEKPQMDANSIVPVRGATHVTGPQARFRPQMSHYPSLDPQQSIDGCLSGGIDRLRYSEAAGSEAATVNSPEYSNLKKLDLAHNRFERFPIELPCVAPSLAELVISNNAIGEVELRFLPATLKKFYAKDCQIVRFGSILNKEQLKTLSQSCVCKQFKDQPCPHRNHRQLANLTSLNLTHNFLTHFQVFYHMPPSSGTPNFGKEENTYQKQVSVAEILFPSLENLDLSHNCLQDLFNPNISHLSTLKAIQLNNNEPLQKIPYEFGHLKKMKGFTELNIKNLPNLVQPPKECQKYMCAHLLTFLAAGLRESELHRTIKLFLVGKGERGKTTLLQRLCSRSDQKVERTEGIDIVKFSYTPSTKSILFGRSKHGQKEPIQFLAWDFAGQEQYHSTHHCFYSRRSLYLAIFRLTDGEEGVRELDSWLRNIQLRARGCPVIIVGTYMDKVDKHRVAYLEAAVKEMYLHRGSDVYPQVVDVVSVSGLNQLLRENNMDKLKKTIYDVATHLHLGRDGQTLVYKPELKADDPSALFQQHVPKSFLTLQQKCHEFVEQCQEWVEPPVEAAGLIQNGVGHEEGLEPVMNEEEFRGHFSSLFDDKEELDEAVTFLHLQGTILHFDDHDLRDLYFLDPQWLAKLMAHVIHPKAIQGDSPVVNGVVQVTHLFWNHGFSDSLKLKYIQLLEKFEVAFKISKTQVLIPSLMPETVVYPQPNDDLRGVIQHSDEYHQPALRRFWLADYIPEGFWPRLICRIATDQQIEKILKRLIGEEDLPTPTGSPDHLKEDEKATTENMLKWKPWKMGVTFSYRGRTLLVVKEEDNAPPEGNNELEWLPAKRRIEIHVYVQEWFEVQTELQSAGHSTTMLEHTFSLPGIATQLLVTISQHMLSLARDWFRGMLKNEFIYIPCWKCYGQMAAKGDVLEADTSARTSNRFFPVNRRDEKFPAFTFNHENCIIPAALGQGLHCPVHGPVKVVHIAPDLIFWDLASLSAYHQDMTSPLEIKENEVLGRGGYGFVCKGELVLGQGRSKKVAVKGFLSDSAGTQHCTVAELLEISRQPENLYQAYKEIRQEVSILAVLDHPNLTKLCGVRVSPHMCLLLELAPRGSLRGMLKEYKKHAAMLEPVTLQSSIDQIASGMEYLHMQQIVHKDMKSPNVLVWHFPSGRISRSKRVEKAGNVWLKLTDYGISQVSTKRTMKLNATPVGTPGYMAPELFGVLGQQISSEKVDVFAFGMVVYELLSLQPPFHNVEVQKRNNPIKEGRRPPLQGRCIWSPLLAQSIMRMCWAHNPDERPTMKEITEWVHREEMIRLRAEISLEKVQSVSCACVCRITPEDEKEFAVSNIQRHSSGIGHNPEHSITSYHLEDVTGSALMSDMDPCMQYTQLQYDESFPPRAESSMILRPITEHGKIASDGSVEDDEESGKEGYQFLHQSKNRESRSFTRQPSLQPYTQVWVCDRREKGLLEIFTYYDSQAGYYAYSTGSNDQITTICPVRNMMWIGTTKGILKLKHAPTLRTMFKGDLTTAGRATTVLTIAHVQKVSTVLVTTNTNEIWAFNDTLTPEGLIIEERMSLERGTNCYQLAVVEVKGSLEVWGTMDNSQLIMLKKQGREWMMEGPYRIDCKQQWQFNHIAHATFEDKNGETQNHLWVPYWEKRYIVCWDLQKREHRTTLETTALRPHDSTKASVSPKVTALVASGKKVLMGTDFGTVGVLDSETCQVLRCLQWHTEKVRTLLLMPKEMEPCVCSEIPLAECDMPSFSTQLHHRPPIRSRLSRQLTIDSDQLPSLPDNPCEVPNVEPERSMVASIGNGRKRFTAADTSGKNDVCLLMWRC